MILKILPKNGASQIFMDCNPIANQWYFDYYTNVILIQTNVMFSLWHFLIVFIILTLYVIVLKGRYLTTFDCGFNSKI